MIKHLILLLVVNHLMIDCIFYQLKLKFTANRLSLFISDQTLHILIIALFAVKFHIPIAFPLEYPAFMFTILLLLKPSGILVDLIFVWIFGGDGAKPTDRDKIGLRIGYFERSIIFLLCIFHSISTIGFILAAKTLVRYEDIGKNKNKFREKYLIGTLSSSVMALSCYGIWSYLLL